MKIIRKGPDQLVRNAKGEFVVQTPIDVAMTTEEAIAFKRVLEQGMKGQIEAAALRMARTEDPLEIATCGRCLHIGHRPHCLVVGCGCLEWVQNDCPGSRRAVDGECPGDDRLALRHGPGCTDYPQLQE